MDAYHDHYARKAEAEKAHDAPEVASPNYPFALTPEGEGLQSVHDQSRDDVREHRTESGAAIVGEGAQQQDDRRRRRSRWLWTTLAVILLLVGLGAGIGIGVAIGQKDDR